MYFYFVLYRTDLISEDYLSFFKTNISNLKKLVSDIKLHNCMMSFVESGLPEIDQSDYDLYKKVVRIVLGISLFSSFESKNKNYKYKFFVNDSPNLSKLDIYNMLQ